MSHPNPAGVDDPFLIGTRVFNFSIPQQPEGIVIGKCFSLDMKWAYYVVEYDVGFVLAHKAVELEHINMKRPDNVRRI